MGNDFLKLQTTFFLFIVISVWILLIPSTGFSSIKRRNVTYSDDGLISVEAKNQRLGPILDQIADVLKLKVYLYDNSGNDKITVSVHDADPEEALFSLLRNRSYCILFGQDAIEVGVERINGLNLNERALGGSSSSGGTSEKRSSSRKNEIRTVLSAGRQLVASKGVTSNETNPHGVAENTEYEDGEINYTGSGINQDQSDRDDDPGGDWESEQYSEAAVSLEYEDADDYYAENYETDDGYWDDEESHNVSSTDSKIASLKNQIENLQEQIESGEAEAWYEKWSNIKGEKYITHPEVTLAQLQEKLNNLQN